MILYIIFIFVFAWSGLNSTDLTDSWAINEDIRVIFVLFVVVLHSTLYDSSKAESDDNQFTCMTCLPLLHINQGEGVVGGA